MALGCAYGLNGWDSYDKISCCFVWKYAQKMIIEFRLKGGARH